jgi:hypothetical protein
VFRRALFAPLDAANLVHGVNADSEEIAHARMDSERGARGFDGHDDGEPRGLIVVEGHPPQKLS